MISILAMCFHIDFHSTMKNVFNTQSARFEKKLKQWNFYFPIKEAKILHA